MKPTARNAALEALLHVTENEGYSNIVLDKTLKEYNLDKRDSALCSHIFYGVLERRITLDYMIRSLLKHPSFTLNPIVQEILRIGAYQTLFLDKIPESAIVNEAVNAAKECKKDSSAGFINGVLRELIRRQDSIPMPDPKTLLGLSVHYSVPEELIALWDESYGRNHTLRLLESLSGRSRTFLRMNTLKTSELAFGAIPYEDLEGAYEMTEGGNLTALPEFDEGLFHVQDLSSQYLCKIADPQENEKIIDVCAAPGGKTFTMAERMNGTGTVYAYDLYKGRVKLIRSGAYRLGLPNVMASMRDARSETCELSDADRILCDVPCSGFGTIRRKPEIRYKPLDTLTELPELQYDILCKSALHLKPGGLLVYSTCTLNPAENGAVVNRFLREHGNFQPEPVTVPRGLRRTVEEPENQLTMMPFAGDTDGFFVALFRLKNETNY